MASAARAELEQAVEDTWTATLPPPALEVPAAAPPPQPAIQTAVSVRARPAAGSRVSGLDPYVPNAETAWATTMPSTSTA
jgi:hypothetical protein